MYQHVALHSFSWLLNIPLYLYTTFYKSIHLLMDTWVVSNFCLLWIMLLQILEYLFKFILWIPFSKHIGVECWVIWQAYLQPSEELKNCFHSGFQYFTFPAALCESLNFSTSSSTLAIFHFFYCNHSSECISLGFKLHFHDD